MPRLNNVAANEKYDDSDCQRFQGEYKDVDLRLPYSGDILISADNLSDEPYFHGHPWPWHFDRTLKLSFSTGHLTAQEDISSILKVFDSRYCTEGYLYGDNRRNGLRFLVGTSGMAFASSVTTPLKKLPPSS
ncbi:hypothetical protein MASR1M6_38020 [Rubrivivax sp.]